jgi:MFS family permease
VSLLAMPFSVLMPIFADRILHAGARGLGLLMAATGVGALASAALLAFRASARGLGRWVAMSASGFGLSLVLFTLSRSLWLSVVLLTVVGFCMVLQMAASNTLLQTLAPDALRGRVMSVYSMMLMGMAPFGALLAGAAASRVGAPAALAAGGAVSFLGALLFATRLPRLRVEARALIAAQQLAGGEPAD